MNWSTMTRKLAGLLMVTVLAAGLSGCAQPVGTGPDAPPSTGAAPSGIAAPASETPDATAGAADSADGATDAASAGRPGEPEPGTPPVWEETELIRLNQMGYRPKDVKQAVVAGTGTVFHLVPAAGGPSVYMGSLAEPVPDSVTGGEICLADFSAFGTPGEYRLVVEGVGGSYPFTIAEDVYAGVDAAVLKFFYFQRCGMALEPAYAGEWAHNACHLGEGAVFGDDNRTWAAPGGWHDAGDYGRYSVNTAVSLADLLLAWEMYPDAFDDGSGIPESGNGVPDILDEARYALQWLLRMQDAQTGGVYHKLSAVNFASMTVMPEHDLLQMYFSPISSTATADYAAVMAMSARVFHPVDETFSAECLAAAEKAWTWLASYDGAPGFSNPKGMQTGEYGDHDDRDERFWAASELYRTTGETVYGDAVRVAFAGGGMSWTGLGWQEVSGFGSLAYLMSAWESRDPVVADGLREKWLADAEKARAHVGADTYGSSLGASEYGWGSNAGVLNRAVQLLVAHRLSPDPKWMAAAESTRHYLLGHNVLGQCYVTGFGTKTVKKPHHRPTLADKTMAPVPGMVAGGPNGALQDPAVKAACEGLPPAACYVDDVTSYSTNEVAINWNAPAVFVFAGLK